MPPRWRTWRGDSGGGGGGRRYVATDASKEASTQRWGLALLVLSLSFFVIFM